MTTEEVNKTLLQNKFLLHNQLKLKHEYEKEYYQKYYKLLLNSGMSNMTKQEAEAKATMFNDPIYDKSVIKIGDTRKSRLTLNMINRLRKAGEARQREQEKEMQVIKKMYGAPPAPM
jgi:hypothetical protein